MNLEQHHISQLLDSLHKDTGIFVSNANRWQVTNRIRALCMTEKCSVQALRNRIKTPERCILYPKLINCIAVQESYFFRDDYFYQLLRNQLFPKLFQQFDKIHIWSAACAEGQEVYSLSILLNNMSPQNPFVIKGSDISSTAVQAAQKGEYPRSQLQRNLSSEEIDLYFQAVDNQHRQHCRIKPTYKKNVSFFEHNLIHPTGRANTYQLIVLRNVLMYFSKEYRELCIENLTRSLQKGGFLIFSNPNTRVIQR